MGDPGVGGGPKNSETGGRAPRRRSAAARRDAGPEIRAASIGPVKGLCCVYRFFFFFFFPRDAMSLAYIA